MSESMNRPDQVSTTDASTITFELNGRLRNAVIDGASTLLSMLRDDLGDTGPKEGCSESECGACMVLVDGAAVNSCCYLAAKADGRAVTTVSGLASAGTLSELQQALLQQGAVQCGFCTPGMLVSATALLADNPTPTRHDIEVALAGNLCRCTGYQRIVVAVAAAAEAINNSPPSSPDSIGQNA